MLISDRSRPGESSQKIYCQCLTIRVKFSSLSLKIEAESGGMYVNLFLFATILTVSQS